MDIVVTITEFKRRLKSIGYAAATIESYRENLGWFVKHLQEQGVTDLRKVSHATILEYQHRVMEKSLATESKALRLRPVKRLFEYLVDTHQLLINPTEGIIETSRKHRKIGPVLTLDEMKKLMNQPNMSLKTHIRNRAIMEVMYSTGIRINELVSLEVYHVDFKEKVLYIRKGKGNKQRVVPLGKAAASYLKEYLENIRPWWSRHDRKERRLFLNHHGKPITGNNIRSFLRRYRLSAGIKKPVSPHTLRRTCATHLLQQGADLVYIKELLGHSHLSTTRFYTKVTPVDIKKVHDKTHPGIKEEHDD